MEFDKFPRIVREESHGLRNPRFFPGEQSRISQLVDFSREKAAGMAISARAPISAQAGGCPYVICQVRLMPGCVVSCRGLGACAGVVSVRGGAVVVVWVPPGW